MNQRPNSDPDNVSSRLLGRGLSRRSLLGRAAALGAATPVVAGLLAACGSSSSTKSAATSTSSSSTASTNGSTPATGSSPAAGGATPSTGASGASASPSSQAAAPSATVAGTTKFTIEPIQHKGGQVVEGFFGDAKTLNSVLATDAASGYVISMIFDPLIQPDPATTEAMASLAKSWQISSDGITYSFELNDGVTWQDGKPFSANDVKFTFDLTMNPNVASPQQSEFSERIKSVDVQDDTHLSITLKAPNASFLIADCTVTIVPQHILQGVDPKALPTHAFSTGKKGVTIGTGPFQFDSWVKDDHLTLTKYAGYWQGEPGLDKWIYKVATNQTVLTQQIKTGEIDYGRIQPSDYDSMKKQSNVKVFSFPVFTFNMYVYQLDPAKTTLFQDKRVRQALLYAINRPQIVKTVDFGLAEVAVGTIPPISWAYNPDGITLKYDYDVEKAKQLLDEAGWKVGSGGIREKDGKKLSFTMYTTSGGDNWVQYMQVFQQEWKQQLGVELTPKTEELNALLTRFTESHDFESVILSFGWGTDPDQSSMWSCAAYKGGYNTNKYCNPQVDKLLADALKTTDHAKRRDLYTQMENILMDDLPSVILDFPNRTWAVNKRVHNLYPNAVNFTFDSHQWWVDA